MLMVIVMMVMTMMVMVTMCMWAPTEPHCRADGPIVRFDFNQLHSISDHNVVDVEDDDEFIISFHGFEKGHQSKAWVSLRLGRYEIQLRAFVILSHVLQILCKEERRMSKIWKWRSEQLKVEANIRTHAFHCVPWWDNCPCAPLMCTTIVLVHFGFLQFGTILRGTFCWNWYGTESELSPDGTIVRVPLSCVPQ